MEQILQTLENIGVSTDPMKVTNEADFKEYALLCIAMFDDRREYVE